MINKTEKHTPTPLPNSSKIVDYIRRADWFKILPDLTPANMEVRYDRHSTGEHCHIYLTLPEEKPLEVWYKTNWFSSIYEFNERDKHIGFQPNCGFATPLVCDFLRNVIEAVEKEEAERAVAKRKREEDEKVAKQAHIDKYKATLTPAGGTLPTNDEVKGGE